MSQQQVNIARNCGRSSDWNTAQPEKGQTVHTTTWKNCKIITLNEKSQTKTRVHAL